MQRPLRQVDVFTTVPYRGNPVAVVLDGDGLSSAEMQRFANWTNLSETTYVLEPTDPGADYRVRIFTPTEELPFAGHPTLGTCHAWLEGGGVPSSDEVVVQECGAGLVPIRRGDDGLAFAAPPLVRSGPVDESMYQSIGRMIATDPAEFVEVVWVDNGPPWIGVLLSTPEQVLAIRPGVGELYVGVVAPLPHGSAEALEVRAFFPTDGGVREDPVTGSLNASLAQWLLGAGHLSAPYVARQGTMMGRSGRVHISTADDEIWVGGGTVTCIAGHVEL